MKKLYLIFFFISVSTLLFGQGELDQQKKIFFRNESSYSFNINSNGWGFNYRYAKRINARNKWTYDGDFNVVKHHKEVKGYNNSAISGSRFVYGKLNYAFAFRGALGKQKELFQKFDKGSVSVRFFYMLGGTLMFLKPIYYTVYVNDHTEDKKFDVSIPNYFIVGRAPVLKGFSEMKFVPGGYLKTGFSFDYSKKDSRISAIDAGICLDVYPIKIKIMETEENQMIFPTVYLSFRFGKVKSGYHFKENTEEQNPVQP